GALHEFAPIVADAHSYAARPELVARSATMLSVDEAHVVSALDALWAAGRIVLENDRVFLARTHRAGVELGRGLRRLVDDQVIPLPHVSASLTAFETRSALELAPQQRRALEAAATHHV